MLVLLYTQSMQKRQTRWWDLPIILFFVAALLASAARLQTTNWTAHLVLTQLAALTGSALGIALGYSLFKPWASFFYGLFFSLVFPVWILGSIFNGEWLYRLERMNIRLGTALGQLIANQPVTDPVLFVTQMILFYWLIGLLGGYFLVRKGKPWLPLLVAALLVLTVDYSFDMFGADDTGALFTIVFFLLLLLIFARLNYLRSQRDWNRSGKMIETEVGMDINRSAAVTAIVLLLLAWFSPRVVKAFTPGTPEQIKMSEDFRAWRQRISNAVSSLESQNPITVETFESTLNLGRGTPLSEEEVFTVRMNAQPSSYYRFYWTGRTYDTFINNQWIAVEESYMPLSPDSTNISYSWQGRPEISFTFTNRIPYLGSMYYVNAPVSISREVQVLQRPTTADGPDITGMEMNPPLTSGESYSVLAAIGVPSVRSMQLSSVEPYPDWVTERYLQLPVDFPDSIRELAESLTAGKPTPYDKTIAITRYLRENMVYTTTVPDPPPDRDLVEWFLFDLQRGFCNYYASAEVLMLRSVGVPTRLSIGYAAGDYNSETKQYSVAAQDYHAWPEVYFPNIGWIAFEPTVSQPASTFPSGENATLNMESSLEPTPVIPPPIEGLENIERGDEAELQAALEKLRRQALIRTVITYGAGAAIIGLLVFAVIRFKKVALKETPLPTWIERKLEVRGIKSPAWLRNWSIRVQRSPIEALFAIVQELLRVWGQPASSGMTASEQVDALVTIVPKLTVDAKALLSEYHRSTYSPYPANLDNARRAVSNLRMNGYTLWAQRLVGYKD